MDSVRHKDDEKAAEDTEKLDDSSVPESVCRTSNEMNRVYALTRITVFPNPSARTCVVARQV